MRDTSDAAPDRSTTPSIRDVARRAEVSVATASRALNDSSAVASATRDRVRRVAHELGYRLPLAPPRTRQVRVVGRYLSQWYFARAMAALEDALAAADRELVLHNLSHPAGWRAFFERALPHREVSALIVVSSSFEPAERRALEQAAVPTVVVGGLVPGFRTVGIDEEAAARMATEHLIGLGHRDIGLISFDPGDLVGRETTQARRRGFEAALTEAGLPVVAHWVSAAVGSRMAGGVAAAERLLTRPRLPTALLAMSDELAIGALQALRRSGLDVPGRISVVGIDDHELARFVDLTTVRQPVAEQAREAVRLLLSDQPAGPTRIDLPVRLVVRGTTGPPG